MERRAASQRSRPVDHAVGAAVHQRTHPVPHLSHRPLTRRPSWADRARPRGTAGRSPSSAGPREAVAVPRHAGLPGPRGGADRRVLRHVVVDVVAQRVDAGQGPVLHGVGEGLHDRGALPDRGLLRLGQAGRVRARPRGVDAQGAQRGAGRNPEAVLLRLGARRGKPRAPQGCENSRFAGPRRMPNGTLPLSG
jgi:hypothetical protein